MLGPGGRRGLCACVVLIRSGILAKHRVGGKRSDEDDDGFHVY